MAAITSIANGNWSSTSTWTGGVVPGSGDSITSAHDITVDVDTTIGTDVAASIAINGSTGTITIPDGVEFTVQGWINMTGANQRLTIEAGGTLTMNSTNNQYFITCGNGQTGTGGVFATGTSAKHATIQSVGGTNEAYLRISGTSTPINATYCDFINMGDAAKQNQMNAPFSLTNCTFTDCGYFQCASVPEDDDCVVEDCTFVNTLGTFDFYLSNCAAPTTGLRSIARNEFTQKSLIMYGNLSNFTIEGNYFHGDVVIGNGTTSTGTGVTYANNYARETTPSAVVKFNVAGTCKDNLLFLHGSTHHLNATPVSAGTYEFDGNVYDGGADAADCLVIYNSLATPPISTFNIHNNISLQGAAGNHSAGTIWNLASKANNLTIQSDHNTYCTTASGTAALMQGADASSIGRTGVLSSFKSNLAWGDASNKDYALQAYNSSRTSTVRQLVDSGTLASVTATSFTDSSASWGTNLFSDVGIAYIRLTSGAANGEVTVITGNSSTTTGTITAWSSTTPTAADTYVIFMDDYYDAINVDYNNFYNTLTGGNLYRRDGTTFSVDGLSDHYLSTGTPQANGLAVDPQFVDDSRNLATYDTASLGNTATVWSSATAYVIGDMVSYQSSTIYGNATINYRCIANNTNQAPGVNTYWEYASQYRLREDLTRIPLIVTWIKAGFETQNTDLHFAGHEGYDIGAVQHADPSSTTQYLPINRSNSLIGR